MNLTVKQYPKFLAFLALFYPDIYASLSRHSEKSDLVEAKLICSNSNHSFQAVVFSEDVAKEGELLEVYSGKDPIGPYAWDWRWVFAVKLLYDGNIFFPLKFKQKVIALPTGKYPLTNVFFDILIDEFNVISKELLTLSKENNISLPKSYESYVNTTNI